MFALRRGHSTSTTIACVWCVVNVVVVVVVVAASTPPATTTTTRSSTTTINDIESYVKKLEYEVGGGGGGGSGVGGGEEVVVVNLNLLPDEELADDILDGVQEEFQTVDAEQGDTALQNDTRDDQKRSRQLSLIYQGVYAPDSRFNAFVDGVMVNMVAEMKRKRIDPLYFRVYDRGIVEHVSTRPRAGRDDPASPSPAASAPQSAPSARRPRQRSNAIGGGVIRGLTNVKRFGNAEVQIAGNNTLVRSHYVFGPINVELLFNTEHGVKSINSTLSALAAHAVTNVNDSSSKLIDFLIDSPSDYEINLVGERSVRYSRLSHSAVTRLFKPYGRLEKRLFRVYRRARSRRIPDVARQSRRRNRNRNRGGNRGNRTTTTTPTTVEGSTVELP